MNCVLYVRRVKYSNSRRNSPRVRIRRAKEGVHLVLDWRERSHETARAERAILPPNIPSGALGIVVVPQRALHIVCDRRHDSVLPSHVACATRCVVVAPEGARHVVVDVEPILPVCGDVNRVDDCDVADERALRRHCHTR